MSWLANIVYIFAAIAYLPILFYQMLRQGKNRRGWGEKLFGPRNGLRSDGGRKRIWVHAVSLGEINAARGIIDGLGSRFPDHQVVISTTTDTGYERACSLYGEGRVFRYPLDFSWTIKRALKRINPAMIVLVELEVWFNLVTIAARREIPVCVVNGRLTERSCRRLAMIGFLTRKMFTPLSWVGAQDASTAKRFVSLGVPSERVSVAGSVKWDTAMVADRITGQDELAASMGIDQAKPLWVCGSTGPGEELIILRAYAGMKKSHPDLQLAIIPRKPERFDQVADLIEKAGFSCLRRSSSSDGTNPPVGSDKTPVLLGDTMGELRKFYSLANVVFVGRSLVPMGGSDPMEVAALAKPILVGPHMENFAQPTELLAAGGGLIQLSGAEGLTAAVKELLADQSQTSRKGGNARQVVLNQQGATGRTLDALSTLIAD